MWCTLVSYNSLAFALLFFYEPFRGGLIGSSYITDASLLNIIYICDVVVLFIICIFVSNIWSFERYSIKIDSFGKLL